MTGSYAGRTGLWFALPALAYVSIIWLLPSVYSVFLSFTDASILPSRPRFVGVRNFVELFVNEEFKAACLNTVGLMAVLVVAELVFATGLALLLWEGGYGARIVERLVVLPLAISPMVAALCFKWLFNEEYGPINYVLSRIAGSTVPWLSSPFWARAAVSVVAFWEVLPLSMLMLLAALRNIPAHLLEAARLDGASKVRILGLVVFPSILPVAGTVAIVVALRAISLFAPVLAITRGGPIFSTELVSLFIYDCAWHKMRLGLACAASTLVLAGCALVSWGYLRAIRGQRLAKEAGQ